MNIDERFEKLEKQIKNLKKMLGGVATLALAALIGGTALGVHAANGFFDTLTAKKLLLKDASVKTRVQLFGSTGNLVLSDSSGKNRVYLNGSSGKLDLKDASGKTRVMLYGSSGKVTAGNITATSISAAHAHTASSSNARKGRNKHSHALTVK